MKEISRLRIAVITNIDFCYAWQRSVLSQLQELPFIDLVVNIRVQNNINQEKSKSFLWKLYLKLDSKLFNPTPYALSKSNFDNLITEIQTIENQGKIESNSLLEYKLDVIINLSDISLSRELINAAKYGVWFLTHCDLDLVNKKPFGIWEMLNKHPETVGVLRYIKQDMLFANTIAKTSSCTDGLSYKRNINAILWQAHLLIISNIKLLAENKDLFIKKLDRNKNIFSNSQIDTPYLYPSNLIICKFSLSLINSKLSQLLKSLVYFNQWALIFNNKTHKINNFDFSYYKKIIPPKDRFWADPFLLKRNGKYYLFIEELIYKNKLGHISVMEIDEEGNYSKPKVILVRDYHLSFPFVFEDNGGIYMIPESSGNRNIQLFKCIDFPLKWELEKILMDNVIAVDTTIYKNEDTYWLFTNIKKHVGASKHVELFAFSSKVLITNEWKSHPLNPVITDVKSSRHAGAFFKVKKKLFRPSQNCSHYYGYGLNIAEVKNLNENDYEENLIYSINPDWDKNINSNHSFNSVENLLIGDIKIKRNRFFKLLILIFFELNSIT